MWLVKHLKYATCTDGSIGNVQQGGMATAYIDCAFESILDELKQYYIDDPAINGERLPYSPSIISCHELNGFMINSKT